MKSKFVTGLAVAVSLFFVGSAEVGAACPEPELTCQLFFPGSVLTGFCLYRDSYEMCYGEEIRVVAADERGLFPRTWHAWTRGTLSTAGAGIPCQLIPKNKKKTDVEIPDELHCAAFLATESGDLYAELFVSNPASSCLGWGECRITPE